MVAAKVLPPKARKRKIAEISREHNVGNEYPRKVVGKLKERKPLATRKGAGGHPGRITAEEEEVLHSALPEEAHPPGRFQLPGAARRQAHGPEGGR